jgi:hypothetical protein
MKATLNFTMEINSNDIGNLDFTIDDCQYHLEEIREFSGDDYWLSKVWMSDLNVIVTDEELIDKLNKELEKFLLQSLEADFMDKTLTQVFEESVITIQ